MWFYKNLSPGDFFLVPVGEEVKVSVPVPVPVPVLNPKTQTKPQARKLPKADPIDVTPLLIPVIITVIEQYWWVIFAL